MTTKTLVHVRWAVRRDFARLMDIEQTAHAYPWTEDEFLAVLRNRNCIAMVAEDRGPSDFLFGYMVYEIQRDRIQLLNMAVAIEHRRERVGTQMMEKLKTKLAAQRRQRIVLECKESNLAAHLFLRASGFRAVKVVRGFYDDCPDDAYVFEYQFGG